MRRGGRAPDLVEARQVGVDVVALQQVHVVGGRTAHLALARRAVVRREDEDRVVELAEVVERVDHPPDVLVDAVDHPGEDLHALALGADEAVALRALVRVGTHEFVAEARDGASQGGFHGPLGRPADLVGGGAKVAAGDEEDLHGGRMGSV